jgi:hypothetical protein
MSLILPKAKTYLKRKKMCNLRTLNVLTTEKSLKNDVALKVPGALKTTACTPPPHMLFNFDKNLGRQHPAFSHSVMNQ